MAKKKATHEAKIAGKSGAEAVDAAPAPAQHTNSEAAELTEQENPITSDQSGNVESNEAQPPSLDKPEATTMLKNAIAKAVKEMSIDKLKHHPLSDKIYSRQPSKELIASILQHGIFQPVLVAQDTFEIIAGNSRVEAARILGITKVPVTMFTSDDPLEIRQAVLETNNQRVKTQEQQIREFLEWLEIEKVLAKRRMSTRHAEGQGVENSAPPEQGKARDKAAAKIGLSGVTAEKGADVVREADKLKSTGEAEKALSLLGMLNGQSINAAYNKGIEMGVLKRPSNDANKSGSNSAKSKPKSKPAPKAKTEPASKADPGPDAEPADVLVPAKISSHDEALAAVDKVTDFVRGQDGNTANKGRTTEWKEAIEVLVDSLKAVGIKVA